MKTIKVMNNNLIGRLTNYAEKVYKNIGSNFPEDTYFKALIIEMKGYTLKKQKTIIPIFYQDERIGKMIFNYSLKDRENNIIVFNIEIENQLKRMLITRKGYGLKKTKYKQL